MLCSVAKCKQILHALFWMLNDLVCFTGMGYVCSTYPGGTPNPMDIVRIFNFNNEICRRYICIQFPLFLDEI